MLESVIKNENDEVQSNQPIRKPRLVLGWKLSQVVFYL